MEPEKSSSAAAKQTMEAEAGDAVDPHELGNKLLPHQIATPQRTPPSSKEDVSAVCARLLIRALS
jgi:hypothetical protein